MRYLGLMLLIFSVACQNHLGSSEKPKSMGQLVTKMDQSIWVIHQDKKKNYWFGSKANGVFRFDGTEIRQFTVAHGLIDQQIRGIQEDHLGNLFFETPNGVSLYDGQGFTPLKVQGSSDDWKLEANDLWFYCNGSLNHVYRYDGTGLIELKIPDDVVGNGTAMAIFGIARDRAGHLWLGTDQAGAIRYDGTSFFRIPYEAFPQFADGRVPGIRSIVEDNQGYFWLSHFLNKYRLVTKEDESGKRVQILDGVKSNQDIKDAPFYLKAVNDGKDLWMVSYARGVWRYDGSKLTQVKTEAGEQDIFFITLYIDNQEKLWLGTDNAGVFRFNGSSFEKMIFP